MFVGLETQLTFPELHCRCSFAWKWSTWIRKKSISAVFGEKTQKQKIQIPLFCLCFHMVSYRFQLVFYLFFWVANVPGFRPRGSLLVARAG